MATRNKKIRRAARRTDGTAALIEHFRARFGRNPGPADPLLWRNGALQAMTPTEMDVAYERLFTLMETSNSDPATVHAARKYGLVLTSFNRHLASAEEQVLWNKAILEYDMQNRPMVVLN